MSLPNRLLFVCALALAGLLSPTLSQAQFPQHKLHAIYPLGGRQGDTVEVQITGTDLENANGLWFDHPGLRAFHIKAQTFRIAIAPGTPPGRHDVRLVGPLGVSNPRTFEVGDRPEAIEKEPNNQPGEANPLVLNSVMNGRMDPAADVDCFAIEGKRGQRLFFEIEAYRVDTRLDATLRLLDPNGREIATNEDEFGADPLLDVTLPADGRYVVKVQDIVYNGSPEHGYRLALREGPYLDAIVPVVAVPGIPSTFTLLGRNLGGATAPSLTVDDRPLETRPVTLTPPSAIGWGMDRPSADLLLSPAAARRGFEYRFEAPGAWSNPLFIAESLDPIVLEVEPNDGQAPPQDVTLPCDISGAFATRGDTDIYRFKAKKGDVWWIEASAECLGSLADPTFVVQRVLEKGPPQDLATGDDQPDPVPASPFPTASVDAVLRWQVPEDGTYQVVLNDSFASQRGGVRLYYRLNVRSPRPDFRLFAIPATPPGQLGDLTVRAGGRELAFVVATRLDGFTSPIRVEALDLPAGITCDPVVIGQGQYQAPLVVTAAPEAKSTEGYVRIMGRALSGDRKEVLDYAAGSGGVRPEPRHEAIPGALVWPPTPLANGSPPLSQVRVTRGLVCAVREGAPFLLSARPESIVAGPGGQLELNVEVERRAGFDEAVQVAATDLPPNLPAANATIAKEAKTAVLKLAVPANVPPGNYTILLRGTGAFPFNKDPNAKDKPKINITAPSNPVSLTVRRP
jgi:hypothetical protein